MRALMVVWGGCLMVGLTSPVAAKSPELEPELNSHGEQIRVGYAQLLSDIGAQIA
ncbi:MAG: hypothetical protein ACI8W8_004624, partial [Rhodothermales bacterium]